MARINIGSSAVFHLFFPHICVGCGSDILPAENILCLTCLNELPFTHFSQHANNASEKIFWGRVPLRSAMALFYFTKASVVQNLIHEFKYKGNKDVGIYLGALMGSSFMNSNRLTKIDAIVPLPLYADKERKRGFKQATVLCKGMSEIMGIPVI